MKNLLLTVALFASCTQNAMSADEFDRRKTTIVSTPEEYVKFLHRPDLQGHVQVGNLVARVLKGRVENDFHTLADDPGRKIVFLMSNDGLDELIGLPKDQMLNKIGYTREYVDDLKHRGFRFKLIVFQSRGPDGQPATWDNLAALVERAYPRIAAKMQAALPELKKASFAELESQAPAKFSQVYSVGQSDANYIDEKRLANSDGKAWQVRAFLFYCLRVTDLFGGDGYTHTADGTKGLKEFICVNKPVKLLPPHVIIDLQ